jgi:hypothetical protein
VLPSPRFRRCLGEPRLVIVRDTSGLERPSRFIPRTYGELHCRSSRSIGSGKLHKMVRRHNRHNPRAPRRTPCLKRKVYSIGTPRGSSGMSTRCSNRPRPAPRRLLLRPTLPNQPRRLRSQRRKSNPSSPASFSRTNPGPVLRSRKSNEAKPALTIRTSPILLSPGQKRTQARRLPSPSCRRSTVRTAVAEAPGGPPITEDAKYPNEPNGPLSA